MDCNSDLISSDVTAVQPFISLVPQFTSGTVLCDVRSDGQGQGIAHLPVV